MLTAITGSAFFPGGLGTHTAPAGTTLTFENGPSQTVGLQWGTYYDAADQAGLSRLWGGIHVSVDDLTGRRVGSQCGLGAWALAQKYFTGSVLQTPVTLTIRKVSPTEWTLGFNTIRGVFYKVQSTLSLNQPFTDAPAGFVPAVDGWTTILDECLGARKFYRVISALAP